jgi:hypothetical protein
MVELDLGIAGAEMTMDLPLVAVGRLLPGSQLGEDAFEYVRHWRVTGRILVTAWAASLGQGAR